MRELVVQRETLPASHENEERTEIPELIANYYIDGTIAENPRSNIIIFDDLLTTGRHFKAMQAVLSHQYPTVRIYGLFVARRAPNTDDVESIF